MPDPGRLLTTIRQAIRAFQETPGRTGRVVRLQEVDEVLVTGDLHGNVDNFRRILQRADLKNHPRRHLVVQEIVHGRVCYPNGGDKSHQMVDLISALKCERPRQTHWLVGNHELAQWTGRVIIKAERELNTLFRDGVTTAYGNRAAEIYALYLELFAALPAAVATPNRVFLSHSLPRASRLGSFDLADLQREENEAISAIGSSLHSLVWGRDVGPTNAEAFLQKVEADLLITGHVPAPDGFLIPNDHQLILDSCGAPAGFCLFPTDRPITHDELIGCVSTI
jgi:hypothetical protein